MKNEDAILAHLNLPKYDAVRDALRASTLDWVRSTINRYLEQVEKLTPAELAEFEVVKDRFYHGPQKTFPTTGYPGIFLVKGAEDAVREGMRAKYHGCMGKGYYAFKRDLILANKAGYVLDLEKIQQHADNQWDQNKRFYAARVGEKITELIEADATIECSLSLESELVGFIKATHGKKVLNLRTSLKTNFRYGENAADGNLTIYRQVPTLIESAYGFDVVARQKQIEDGIKLKASDRKALLLTLQTEISVLERRKRKVDDLYSTLSFCSKREEGLTHGNLASVQEEVKALGLSEIPTLANAKAAVKEVREAVKAAKEKLKLARAAK